MTATPAAMMTLIKSGFCTKKAPHCGIEFLTRSNPGFDEVLEEIGDLLETRLRGLRDGFLGRRPSRKWEHLASTPVWDRCGLRSWRRRRSRHRRGSRTRMSEGIWTRDSLRNLFAHLTGFGNPLGNTGSFSHPVRFGPAMGPKRIRKDARLAPTKHNFDNDIRLRKK
jgi:hypothetical protein